MSFYFSFTLRKNADLDDAWEALLDAGIQPLYSEESADRPGVIVACCETCEDWTDVFPFIEKAEPFSMHIDWEAEWRKHCPEYQDDGYVHVNLASYGGSGEILLRPGPGFGDLTHPTTRVVLQMMAPFVRGRHVIDIGSGSGILSIAAVSMGAKSVLGVEIDPQAIVHAVQNAAVNGMEDKVRFMLPEEVKPVDDEDLVVLMNMISSEQEVAWKSLPQLHTIPGDSLVSGLIEPGKEDYLRIAEAWGWTFVEEIHLKSWLGMRFKRF